MTAPRLTICIPTIPERRSLLSRCLFHATQLSDWAEILVADGARPMGDKLNQMFAAASGTYVVALDDDDYLSGEVTSALSYMGSGGWDFIGHDILWLEDGRFAGIVRHSLDGDPEWGSLDRGVSPKCPVRTEIARSVPFGNEYTADRKWSKAVHAQCRTGSYLPAALYVYDHWNGHMVGTSPDDPRYRNGQRDVGMWPYDESRVAWLA